MRRTKSIAWLFALTIILSSCSFGHLYLVKQQNVTPPRDIEWKCLAHANSRLSSGLRTLSGEERALLKGHEVKYFLWWGSLSGPKPVADVDGHPSEAKTLFPVTDKYKVDLAEQYVLCLLMNGYRWPDEEISKR